MIAVSFYAYERPMRELFYKGESFAQIHGILSNICSTYQPIEILEHVEEGVNLPLSLLTSFEKIDTRVKMDFGAILESHTTFIDKIVFIDVAVLVAPKVFAAYTKHAKEYSSELVKECLIEKTKHTPQRAAEIFPQLVKQGFNYEV